MSAPPKIPAATRNEIAETVARRRALQREIARLIDERRAIPNNKQLAESFGVSYSVVRRTLHGDPYRNEHPADRTEDRCDANSHEAKGDKHPPQVICA